MACLDHTGVRPTFAKSGLGWKGALKDASGRTVWMCDHAHNNRDQSSRYAGPSACACAAAEVARRFPAEVREMNRKGEWR